MGWLVEGYWPWWGCGIAFAVLVVGVWLIERRLLGVSGQTLETYGAVSDPVAREMAEGVRRELKADLGLAVTGIAGPDGGTEEKPVGTVHIGLAFRSKTVSGKYRFWGKREQNKMNSAVMALDWVRRVLHGNPFLPGL